MAVKRAAAHRTTISRRKSSPVKAKAPGDSPAKRTPRKKAAAPAARPAAKRMPAKAPVATKRVRKKAPATGDANTLHSIVLAALADMKALNVRALDVRGLTDVTDTMVVASGTSDRHVRSIADRVVQRCKESGFRPYGVEGQRDGEWVLLDLHDLVLHVMLPRAREFYALEKLWEGASAAA